MTRHDGGTPCRGSETAGGSGSTADRSAVLRTSCAGGCGGTSAGSEETQAVDTGAFTDFADTGALVPARPVEAAPSLHVDLPDGGLLAVDDEGEEVETLEQALAALGYDPGTADGLFDKRTRGAVVAFQRDRQLVPDGIVGPKTADALNAALTEQASGTAGTGG